MGLKDFVSAFTLDQNQVIYAWYKIKIHRIYPSESATPMFGKRNSKNVIDALTDLLILFESTAFIRSENGPNPFRKLQGTYLR